jgi:hypothetical protein
MIGRKMESPGHHHHHKEGSDHYHTKDCDKRWKAQGITITTTNYSASKSQ